VKKKLAIFLVVAVVLLAPAIMGVAEMMLTSNLRLAPRQEQMGKSFLAEHLGVSTADIETVAGYGGTYLHGPFEIEFRVGEDSYTVTNENTRLRSYYGLKGKMRVHNSF
jgi:hypothetical protein